MLNKESLDIWYNYLKKEANNSTMSDRILALNNLEDRTEEENRELSIFLKLEKKMLKEASTRIEHNKKVVAKLNKYRIILEPDERLSIIFLQRVQDEMLIKERLTPDEVDELYLAMMTEDMDVAGHEKLNELYKLYLDYDDGLDDIPETCGKENCIYCSPANEAELELADYNLLTGGYYEKIDKEGMMDLMILVNRLENELAVFMDLGCEIEFENEEENDDEDDDENDIPM